MGKGKGPDLSKVIFAEVPELPPELIKNPGPEVIPVVDYLDSLPEEDQQDILRMMKRMRDETNRQRAARAKKKI